MTLLKQKQDAMSNHRRALFLECKGGQEVIFNYEVWCLVYGRYLINIKRIIWATESRIRICSHSWKNMRTPGVGRQLGRSCKGEKQDMREVWRENLF